MKPIFSHKVLPPMISVLDDSDRDILQKYAVLFHINTVDHMRKFFRFNCCENSTFYILMLLFVIFPVVD